jgi:hypothetical protein
LEHRTRKEPIAYGHDAEVPCSHHDITDLIWMYPNTHRQIRTRQAWPARPRHELGHARRRIRHSQIVELLGSAWPEWRQRIDDYTATDRTDR